jgi:hypothetical protein
LIPRAETRGLGAHQLGSSCSFKDPDDNTWLLQEVTTRRPRVRDGETAAKVHKALITPLRDRYVIELADGAELSAKRKIVNHEYEIKRDGKKIAAVSKRWFRIRDTYGIDALPGENDPLILAATVCIDEMSSRRGCASHASFSAERMHEAVSISVYPGGSGSGISIRTHPV